MTGELTEGSTPQQPQPELKIKIPPSISEKLGREKVAEMRNKTAPQVKLPPELTSGVIDRDKSMIAGLPEGDPERNSLSAELRPITEPAEKWQQNEEEAAAVQATVMKQFSEDLMEAGDDPLKQRAVIDAYFEGKQPGDALLYRANALRLRTNLEGAESLLFRLHPRDRIAARVIDRKARDERRKFYDEAQQVKESTRQEIEVNFEQMRQAEGNPQLDALRSKVTERLQPLLARLPKEFLTQSGVEDYKATRLAGLKDPVRKLAFRASSGLLTSAEASLGCEIILNDRGEIVSIEMPEEGGSSLLNQLVETEMAMEEAKTRLSGLKERTKRGDLSVASKITGLGEYLKEQVELRESLTELMGAKLGLSLKEIVTHPKELISSVNSRNIFTEMVDKGVIGAETAAAAAIVYEAAHLGGDKLNQMADKLARQLQVAPEQLRLLLQKAAETGQEFVKQAQAQNIPGGDQALVGSARYWSQVHSLDSFIKNAPGLKNLYESLSTGLHQAAPWAAGVAASVSLGREKIASTIRGVTSRFRRRG